MNASVGVSLECLRPYASKSAALIAIQEAILDVLQCKVYFSMNVLSGSDEWKIVDTTRWLVQVGLAQPVTMMSIGDELTLKMPMLKWLPVVVCKGVGLLDLIRLLCSLHSSKI